MFLFREAATSDEDAIFEELSEPDTERMVHIDNFDTDPPPPTMRCPTR